MRIVVEVAVGRHEWMDGDEGVEGGEDGRNELALARSSMKLARTLEGHVVWV